MKFYMVSSPDIAQQVINMSYSKFWLSKDQKTSKHTGPPPEGNRRPGYTEEWKGQGTEAILSQSLSVRLACRNPRGQTERLEQEWCTFGERGSEQGTFEQTGYS